MVEHEFGHHNGVQFLLATTGHRMTPKFLTPPDQLTPAERAAEITAILTRCIVRQHAENRDIEADFRLGFCPGRRVHTTPSQPEPLS